LLLYATGLRISEALGLAIGDVDLDGRTLFIAQTKFFKSRWVPISASLADQLRIYRAARTNAVLPARHDDPFFISSSGKPASTRQPRVVDGFGCTTCGTHLPPIV
jgi:integrase/recombinase XerD